MAFVDELLKKAKAAGKTIVLCEGEDKRVVDAASKIVKDGIAKIILIGSDEAIKASGSTADLSGVTIVDPDKDACRVFVCSCGFQRCIGNCFV